MCTPVGGGSWHTWMCGGSGKHHVYLSVREAQGPPHSCPVKCVVVLEVHFSPNWPLSRLLMATRSKLGVGGRGRMCFVCVCVWGGRSEESGRSLPAHSTTPSFFSVCWGPLDLHSTCPLRQLPKNLAHWAWMYSTHRQSLKKSWLICCCLVLRQCLST